MKQPEGKGPNSHLDRSDREKFRRWLPVLSEGKFGRPSFYCPLGLARARHLESPFTELEESR